MVRIFLERDVGHEIENAGQSDPNGKASEKAGKEKQLDVHDLEVRVQFGRIQQIRIVQRRHNISRQSGGERGASPIAERSARREKF